MGVPIEASSTAADAFDQLEFTIETRLGITPAIIPDGYAQGSRGASEQSKPAQSPILNLSANSFALYVTVGGIEVYAVGYVDDTEHYGKGIDDLVQIIKELGVGSIATGICFAFAKFISFAAMH